MIRPLTELCTSTTVSIGHERPDGGVGPTQSTSALAPLVTLWVARVPVVDVEASKPIVELMIFALIEVTRSRCDKTSTAAGKFVFVSVSEEKYHVKMEPEQSAGN